MPTTFKLTTKFSPKTVIKFLQCNIASYTYITLKRKELTHLFNINHVHHTAFGKIQEWPWGCRCEKVKCRI